MAILFPNLFPEDTPIAFGRSVLHDENGKWIEVTEHSNI